MTDASPPIKLQAPRYSDAAFPPYRFLPGHHPHPTADPRGHSYHAPDQPPPKVTPVPPERWYDSPDYLYGCDLYNHGYWWEAHEAWEGLWQVTDKRGTQGRFLQGLIQTAACHLKRHLGQLRAVRRLRATLLAHFDFALLGIDAQIYMGLDVTEFLARYRAYYAHITETSDKVMAHDAESYPYVRLQFKPAT